MSALRYRVTVKLKEKGESVCPSLLCDASFRLKGMGRDNHFVREWGWVGAKYTGIYSKVMSRGKREKNVRDTTLLCVCVLETRSGVRSVIEKKGVNVCVYPTIRGADRG